MNQLRYFASTAGGNEQAALRVIVNTGGLLTAGHFVARDGLAALHIDYSDFGAVVDVDVRASPAIGYTGLRLSAQGYRTHCRASCQVDYGCAPIITVHDERQFSSGAIERAVQVPAPSEYAPSRRRNCGQTAWQCCFLHSLTTSAAYLESA